MKKIYTFILGLLFLLSTAQQTISFESSEGYTLGDLNNQNGWTVTETSDGPLTNQVVTDEFSKTGIFSFKNANVPEYSDQFFPIFGIEKSFSPAFNYKDFTISYDFYAPTQGGSDFEFALYSINEQDQTFDILLAVGFENRGLIYLYPQKNFSGFTYAAEEWKINQWYNMKVNITQEKITFYLDDKEIYTGDNTSKVRIDGMNFLHNNFGGDAYYDNIKINGNSLAVKNAKTGKLNIFPNPIIDMLNIKLPTGENGDFIEIYNIAGQKIRSLKSKKIVDLKDLPTGTYILKVKTTTGTIYSSKFIKE